MVISKSKIAILAVIFIAVCLTSGFFIYKKSQNTPKKSNLEDVKILADQAKDGNVQPPFEIPDLKPLTFPAKICNIKDYGAKEGGNIINSKAINDAVLDCVRAGGGQVLVPEGKWLTGAIHLGTNIDFHLDKGAEIVFSTNPDDYLPVVFTRFEGMELYNYSPFVYAKDSENISISGEGKFDGQGLAWNDWNHSQEKAVRRLYKMSDNNVPVESRIFGTKKDALRPSFIQFVNCKNVFVSGISAINGPMWTLHFLYSENIKVEKITVETEGHNTDGVVIDSSKNALIENSVFNTGDDAISIKSGLDSEGWRIGKPTENVVIRNSIMENSHSGVGIGSEMSGGIRNVFAYNNHFINSNRGIYLKSLPGRGGFIENIWFRDINMENIDEGAIQIDMSYSAFTVLPHTKGLPRFNNISFENISCDGADSAVTITGLPDQAAQEINIKNINVRSKNGIYIDNGDNILIDNANINVKTDPLFTLENSRNIEISNSSCPQDTANCLSIKGDKSGEIKLKGSSSSMEGKINFGPEVSQKTVNLEK